MSPGRVCVCVCALTCICVLILLCVHLYLLPSLENKLLKLFCPFFHPASLLPVHPSISPSLLAGPRPLCPVVWAVFWRRTGAVSFPWPRPVLSAGRPGGEGGGGPGIRVRAQWLCAVVSTLLTLTLFQGHAGVQLAELSSRCSAVCSLSLGIRALESGREKNPSRV